MRARGQQRAGCPRARAESAKQPGLGFPGAPAGTAWGCRLRARAGRAGRVWLTPAAPLPSFLVSVLYSKAKLASACGGIIYFLSYVPYMYVAIREEVAHDKITAFEKCIAVRALGGGGGRGGRGGSDLCRGH